MTPSEIKRLREQFPPRCYRPGEDFEEYLIYVGKHQLAQSLIADHEEELNSKGLDASMAEYLGDDD